VSQPEAELLEVEGAEGLPTEDVITFATDPIWLGLQISQAQETLLRTIYGLPLVNQEQVDLFHQCTGLQKYPGHPFAEVTVICGAGSGKDSRIAATVVLYEAFFGGHHKRLADGEIGVIPLIAQDQRSTEIAYSYIKAGMDKCCAGSWRKTASSARP
jgi:hypothetical protein